MDVGVECDQSGLYMLFHRHLAVPIAWRVSNEFATTLQTGVLNCQLEQGGNQDTVM